jgi:ubiquinone/menaquinone biosynthesis C-methylase UbiE
MDSGNAQDSIGSACDLVVRRRPLGSSSMAPQNGPWEAYTDRASLYAQFRLDYPPELVAEVAAFTGLSSEHAMADIGTGTGKLTQHFLDRVGRVYCVEPNAAMLREAESRLGGHEGFIAVPGRAEATGLATGSVHLIVAGMALDWFDPRTSLPEFQRILSPAGWFAAFQYRLGKSFLQGLASHLGEIPKSRQVAKPGSNDPTVYLAPGYSILERSCSCDETWEQFLGGALSAAGAPAVGHPDYEGFCAAHRRAFLALSVNGTVRVDYTCTAMVGRLHELELSSRCSRGYCCG